MRRCPPSSTLTDPLFPYTTRFRSLDQFRTELVATTAHDLRTPLTIIIGFAQTLTDFGDRLGPGEQAGLLQRIISNTRRLSEFVDNLLQFARDRKSTRLHSSH